MKNKIIGLVMVLSMLAAFMPIAYAADIIDSGNCGENVTWAVDSEGTLTISGNGDMDDYINANDTPWTPYFETIKKIVVEDGITSIGYNAFGMCIYAETAYMPESVSFINYCAFVHNQKMKSITIPNSVTQINGWAFTYCQALEHVVIGDSVQTIGEYTFQGCDKLSDIVIPKSVSTVENGAFSQCKSLVMVNYEGSASDWEKINIGENNDFLTKAKINYDYTQDSEDGNKDETDIRILLNNRFVSCDQNPVIIEGRTLVPMRAIFEALGAEVNWDGNTRTATGVRDGRTVAVSIDKNEIVVDGTSKEIDVPAQIINDYTMIPVRAVAEAYDCIVSWNGYHRYVVISPANQKPYKIEALNSDGEVSASAEFDNYGRVTSLSGKKVLLKPFYTNINGNSFERDADLGNVTFTYDGNNLTQIYMENNEAMDLIYSYQYDGNVIKSKNYVSFNGTDDYRYYDNICYLGTTPMNAEEPDKYIFGANGLLEKYTFFSNGHWYRSFIYGEDGRILSYSHTYDSAEYNYDNNGKIISASVKTGYGYSPSEEYTYRYVE